MVSGHYYIPMPSPGEVRRGMQIWRQGFPLIILCLFSKIRFYWLQSNLDNSRLLHSVKILSPVVRVNVYGNYLVVALRDGHITIYHLSRAILPTKGLLFPPPSPRPLHLPLLILPPPPPPPLSPLPSPGLVVTVAQVHEYSVVKSVPHPWANTLISMVPSSIRTEPGPWH